MSFPPPPEPHGGKYPQTQPVPRWGLGDAGLAFGIGIATAVAAVIAYPLVTGKTQAHALENDVWFTIISALAQQVGTAFACIWLVRSKGSDPRSALGLSFRVSDVAFIPVGFVFAMIAGAVIAPLQNLGNHETQDIVTNLNKSSGLALAVFSVVVLVAAPIGEELLFRGVLLRSLLRRINPLSAIVVSAGIFAVVHVADPNALIALPALFAFGLLLAVVAMRTGRLGSSMCLHFGFNLLAVVGAIWS